MVDLGTGNNNKINWSIDDKQEMIDIIEVAIFFTLQYDGSKSVRKTNFIDLICSTDRLSWSS